MRVCVSVSVSVSVCVCVCVCVCVYVCACADLEEQEIQELLAEQEGDGEEVEQRSKRPHLDSRCNQWPSTLHSACASSVEPA